VVVGNGPLDEPAGLQAANSTIAQRPNARTTVLAHLNDPVIVTSIPLSRRK
jgi:hypothetical protein